MRDAALNKRRDEIQLTSSLETAELPSLPLPGVGVAVLNVVQGDGLLERDGILAGVWKRGLHAYRAGIQRIH